MSEHLDNPLPPPVTDEARRLRGELDLVTKSRDAWEAEARQAKIEAAAQRDGDRMWMDLETTRFRDRIAEIGAQAARAEEDRLTTHRLLNEALAQVEGLKAELAATRLAHDQACEDLGDAAADVDRLNEQIDSERLGYKREVGRLKDELAQTQARAARTEEDRLAAYRLLDKALAEAEGLKTELAQAREQWGKETAAHAQALHGALDRYGDQRAKAESAADELLGAQANIEDLHAAIEARDREIAALKATPPKIWHCTEIAPTPDLATCVRLLGLARGAEEVEAVARVVARLLGQGGVA